MATTTLQQWNPTQANQESDAEYVADSTRIAGAATSAIMPSPLGNKLYNQLGNYLFALFTAFANKGFGTTDVDVSALTAQCGNFLTTADVKGGQAVPFSPAPTFACAQYGQFSLLLTGAVTGLAVTGASVFQLVTMVFVQDGVGGRTVAFPSNVKSPGIPATAANAVSIQTFMQLSDGNLHPVTPMVVS